MAQVIVKKARFVVSPRVQDARMRLVPIPKTNLVVALDDEFIKAYRESGR